MKVKEILIHIVICVVLLTVILGIPSIVYLIPKLQSGETGEIEAQASTSLPDNPSGVYYVFMNKELHSTTISEWEIFLTSTGEDLVIIFDDISCLVAQGDTNGIQTAQWIQASLPENQMTISTENPILLASKLETGYVDVVVMSKDMTEVLSIEVNELEYVYVIEIIEEDDA